MHRRRNALVSLLVAAMLVTAACSGSSSPEASDEFCEAAATYDADLPTLSTQEQINLVSTMASTAPAEIEDDIEVFLDALESVAADDDSVIDDPQIQESVDNVNRFASEACELFEGNSPYG